MASSINASTSGAGGVITTADNSGVLNLQSGGVTVATINSTGIVMASNTAPTFSAYQNVAQTVSQNVATKITFDVTEWNVGSGYSTSTSRFTPQVAGYYQVVAAVASQNAGGGTVEMDLYKNGSTYKNGFSFGGSGINYYRSQFTAMVYMNGSTDYLEIYWYQNSSSGSRTTVTGSADTYFQAAMVRSA